jgi:thioredoxin 1
MRRLLVFLLLTFTLAPATLSEQQPFPPFDHWRTTVLSGDSNALSVLYIKSPAAQITNVSGSPISFQDDLAFWSSLKSKGLASISADIAPQKDPQPNLHVLLIQLTLTFKPGIIPRKEFVAMLQGWAQQGDQWFLAIEQRTNATRLRQPLERKQIYAPAANANAEIAEAVHTASASHKRVLVVFGGNWCFDCHVLDEAFHSPEIAPALNKSFLVVHVDIGQMDKNLDVAKKYDIPLDRGVPAIAVLDSDGKLLFSQKRGEFEATRSMAPEDILAFLHKWQPRS